MLNTKFHELFHCVIWVSTMLTTCMTAPVGTIRYHSGTAKQFPSSPLSLFLSLSLSFSLSLSLSFFLSVSLSDSRVKKKKSFHTHCVYLIAITIRVRFPTIAVQLSNLLRNSLSSYKAPLPRKGRYILLYFWV